VTRILGIETSCDETAVAVVRDGRYVESNVIASQTDLHARYGGVMPEQASRAHLRAILPVLEEALAVADADWGDLDAIAVTHGPGLAGALLVGVNVAKGLAFARNKPLLGVNHLEGHVYANWLRTLSPEGTAEQDSFRLSDTDERRGQAKGGSSEGGAAVPLPGEARSRQSGSSPGSPVSPSAANERASGPAAGDGGKAEPAFPLVALIVSGGHTDLVLSDGHGQYRRLGRTRDDAAGEAFDKVARLLGLGFPGGPLIEREAANGDPTRFNFPRAWLEPDSWDFSFSGIKTAVRHQVRDLGVDPDHASPEERRARLPVADLAASFQAAVVDVLATRAARAAHEFGASRLALGGGVAANRTLLRAIEERAQLPVLCPPPRLCTDNAAMIAAAGFFRFTAGERSDLRLDVAPNLPIA
jgi:N6-L-threonylcarbamoyladenine synthase